MFTFDLKKIFRFIWSDGPWIERFFKENRMFQCNSKSYKEENACSSSLVIITLEMKHSRQQSKDFCQTLDFKTNSYCLKITQNVVFFGISHQFTRNSLRSQCWMRLFLSTKLYWLECNTCYCCQMNDAALKASKANGSKVTIVVRLIIENLSTTVSSDEAQSNLPFKLQ